jgi:hypothetical protein
MFFQMTISYDSVHDATDDRNPGSVEWSVTLENPSDKCKQKLADIYVDMVEKYNGEKCNAEDLLNGAGSLSPSSLVLMAVVLMATNFSFF